jgi:hypothetical protein
MNIRHNATMYTKYAVSYLRAKAAGEYLWADHFAGIARHYGDHVVSEGGAFGEALLTYCVDEARVLAVHDKQNAYDRPY